MAQPSHHSVFPRLVVLQLGLGHFHHLWLVDGDLLLAYRQLIEDFTPHHLLNLPSLRLVWSLLPPVSCSIEPTSPSIRRFLRLHQPAYVNLELVDLVEDLLQVKPVGETLHVVLDFLRLLPLLAELDPADVAQHEGDGVLIEEEELHLLTEGQLSLLLLLPFRGLCLLIVREL